MQHQYSSMWKPGLRANQQNSAIYAALQRRLQEGAHKVLSGQLVPDVRTSEATQDENSESQEEGQATPRQSAHQRDGRDVLDTNFRFPATKKPFSKHEQYETDCGGSVVPSYSEAPRDSTSPASDTTLFEEPDVYSLNQLKSGEGHQPYVPYDRAGKPVNSSETYSTPVPRRRVRHQRELSTDSVLNTARTPLRARAKTNDGMLQFMANPSKEPSTVVPARRRHRHKISLNIPVVTSAPRPEHVQHANLSPERTESPRRMRAHDAILLAPLTLAERELEYKQRRIFIGTASLDDLLEILEYTPGHTTSRDAVSKAFIVLSSCEQLHARQLSRKPDGWDLVSRVTPDVTDNDYAAQFHVKLGSITLRHFLDLIPFDPQEEVEALRVVEAFLAASHMDAKASMGTGSRARIFRSWMVSQEDVKR